MRRIPVLVALPVAALAALPAISVEYATEAEARQRMFPQADGFADASVALTRDQRREIERLGGVRQRRDTQVVRRVERAGATTGWFFVDEVVGKHDYITYAVGMTTAGEVVGVEVLVYRETYGFQIHEETWRKAFRGATLADPPRLDDDIPNITGATLSCRNVTNGVRRLLALHAVVLADER